MKTICTIEEFEDFYVLYTLEEFDKCETSVTYALNKKGIKLKNRVRPVLEHEATCSIVDLEEQTCSCPAFTMRPKQGACKHLKSLNFAVEKNLLQLFLEQQTEGYEL